MKYEIKVKIMEHKLIAKHKMCIVAQFDGTHISQLAEFTLHSSVDSDLDPEWRKTESKTKEEEEKITNVLMPQIPNGD